MPPARVPWQGKTPGRIQSKTDLHEVWGAAPWPPPTDEPGVGETSEDCREVASAAVDVEVDPTSSASRANAARGRPPKKTIAKEREEVTVLRQMLRSSIYKGCDVRVATASLLDPKSWPRRSLEPSRWTWRVVLAFPIKGSHINVLELRAVISAVEWRCRSVRNIRTRAVHATDSQVVMAVVAKGRSSSRILNFALKRLNALLLASSIRLALVYVRTDLNPADRPSRWRR